LLNFGYGEVMLRLLACLTFALTCLSAFAQEPTPPPAAPAGPPLPIRVEVDGRIVQFKGLPPKAIAGRLLVPMRGIFEEMGAYVEFDTTRKRVTARMGNEELQLTLGDRIARRNGAEILMDLPPQVVEGTVMVPLRFIAESLKARVEYLKAENLVKITTAEATPEEEPRS
jgi:hypothetical protein